MKFSGAVGCIPGKSDYILGPIAPIIYRKSTCKNGGLDGLQFLSASNVLLLAALFHSDNLMEMEYGK